MTRYLPFYTYFVSLIQSNDGIIARSGKSALLAINHTPPSNPHPQSLHIGTPAAAPPAPLTPNSALLPKILKILKF